MNSASTFWGASGRALQGFDNWRIVRVVCNVKLEFAARCLQDRSGALASTPAEDDTKLQHYPQDLQHDSCLTYKLSRYTNIISRSRLAVQSSLSGRLLQSYDARLPLKASLDVRPQGRVEGSRTGSWKIKASDP